METKLYLAYWFIFGNALLISCQDALYKQLVCVDKEDCFSCHRAADFCYWCDDFHYNLNSGSPSCNVRESLLESGCPQQSLLGSTKTFPFINKDEPLRDVSSADPSSTNQIRPQKITLALKPGETQSVSFDYRLAENYPLDLYYLMDLTWSMRDDKETLVGLKNDLPIALEKLTDHFRLGFGGFADKPLMPYIAMDEGHRKNPCSTEDAVCEPTYTFRHRLSLTNKVSDFVSAVNSSTVTGNLDNTEAGMEALMQVVVCGEELGWNPDSRKIVIFATDGLMHFAGMGKLGGVVKRNDERCHLDNNGFYTEPTMMDYPSLSQINNILFEKKVNVIFAVTESVQNDYNKIHDLLPENTYVGRLESDSSNILSLVKQGYQDFVSVISFKDDSDGSIKLTYYSDCGTGGPLIETSKCEGVNIGQTYKFTVKISMDECSKDDHGKVKTIVISESQMRNQKLTLYVNQHCKCECKPQLAFKACPVNSESVCGKCTCLSGWSGPNCDCNVEDALGGGVLLARRCVAPGSTAECSAVGDCMCGVCACDRGYTGAFCQCRECDKSPDNGLECGGPGHGACSCGTCVCQTGWEGAACSCSTSAERCVLPGDTQVCSGRGVCNCGECHCSREEAGRSYTGKFCETCANCNNTACLLYESCATAAALGGPTGEACSSSEGVLYVPTLVEEGVEPPADANLCNLRLEDDSQSCDRRFTYAVQKDWTVLIRVFPKTCTSYMRAAIGGLTIFFTLVTAGVLAIFIWKCCQIRKEKLMYKSFEAQVIMQMEGLQNQEENPLYKSPISEFTMPADFNRSKTE